MRHLFAALTLGAALGLQCAGAQAEQKQVVTLACCSGEAAYEPFVYALKTGKVSSPAVEVKVVDLPIPALLQATGTKQYDLIETTVLGVPTALERGLDGQIVATAGIVRGGRYLMVKKTSQYNSVEDLKGKIVGMTALASTASAHLRLVLAKKYKLNVALENGSFQWVDLPMGTLPTALLRDQVASAFLFHTPALKSLQSGDFRVLMDMPKEYRELFGVDPLTSVILSYKSTTAERGAAIREAIGLMRASAQWAESHRDEVYAAIARERNMSPRDLTTLAHDWYEVNFKLGPEETKMIQNIWTVGQDLGLLKSSPTLDAIVWR
jgi:NitT/TauT family transport system substrate-binding protein